MGENLTCASALKEWAVAIEALGTGRQALIIRKGGIREEGNRFEVRYPSFLLFPSFEHQQLDLLRPEHTEALSEAMAAEAPEHEEEGLTFTHYATVEQSFPIATPEQLEALSSHHIWSDAYAEKRLMWRPKQALTAMVLRVYALPEPVTTPWHPEYAGCKSWLPLLDEVSIDGMSPALSDEEFAAESQAITDAAAAAGVGEWTHELLQASTHMRLAPASAASEE